MCTTLSEWTNKQKEILAEWHHHSPESGSLVHVCSPLCLRGSDNDPFLVCSETGYVVDINFTSGVRSHETQLSYSDFMRSDGTAKRRKSSSVDTFEIVFGADLKLLHDGLFEKIKKGGLPSIKLLYSKICCSIQRISLGLQPMSESEFASIMTNFVSQKDELYEKIKEWHLKVTPKVRSYLHASTSKVITPSQTYNVLVDILSTGVNHNGKECVESDVRFGVLQYIVFELKESSPIIQTTAHSSYRRLYASAIRRLMS